MGIVWCAAWLYVLIEELIYINDNYTQPAGKLQYVTVGTLKFSDNNCSYRNSNNDTYNVSLAFAILIKSGIAVFVLKGVGFVLHMLKPERRTARAKGGFLGVAFFVWFISMCTWVYRKAGRECSCSEDYPCSSANPFAPIWTEVGSFMNNSLIALWVFGAVLIVVACLAVVCSRRRR